MKRGAASIILRALQLALAYLLFKSIVESAAAPLINGVSVREVLFLFYLLSLAPLVYPQYFFAPAALAVVSLLVSPSLDIAYNSIILSLISFMLLWARAANFEVRVFERRRLLASTMIVSGLYVLAAAAGYASVLAAKWSYHAGAPLPGEISALVSLLRPSIAYKLLILSLILVVSYKSVSAVFEIIVTWKGGTRLRKALGERLAEKERRVLAGFEGDQYPVLDWSSGLLLTLLLAPVLYPAFEALVKGILRFFNVDAAGYTGIAASLIATLVLWPINRYLVRELVKPHSLSKLSKPAPEKLLVLGGVFTISLLLLMELTGYNPVAILGDVIQGRMPPSGPFSKLLVEPDERYYQGLYKLLELLVQLFWGG